MASKDESSQQQPDPHLDAAVNAPHHERRPKHSSRKASPKSHAHKDHTDAHIQDANEQHCSKRSPNVQTYLKCETHSSRFDENNPESTNIYIQCQKPITSKCESRQLNCHDYTTIMPLHVVNMIGEQILDPAYQNMDSISCQPQCQQACMPIPRVKTLPSLYAPDYAMQKPSYPRMTNRQMIAGWDPFRLKTMAILLTCFFIWMLVFFPLLKHNLL